MDLNISTNNKSDIFYNKDEAPPATSELININEVGGGENIKKKEPKTNFIIQITPFYIDKLKYEHYIDIIKFIMDNCNLTLKNNFTFHNDIFRIKKKKRKNSENLYYKLSLTKEEKKRIKENVEKKITEYREEIKKINKEEMHKEFNLNNNINNINIQKEYKGHLKSKHKYEYLNNGEIFEKHSNDCYKNNNNLDTIDNNKFKINLKEERNIKILEQEINLNNINNNNQFKINNNENKINDSKENMNLIKEEKNIIYETELTKIDKNLKNNKKNKNESSYYYQCYIDGKYFGTEKNYIKHFEYYHPNDSPFYCYQCHKKFYSYDAINKHNIAKGHNE